MYKNQYIYISIDGKVSSVVHVLPFFYFLIDQSNIVLRVSFRGVRGGGAAAQP